MSEKIYLTKPQQNFLKEMLEIEDIKEAAQYFALMMVEEKADPTQLQKYVERIMQKMEKNNV